jgi:hypothetical protein
MVGVESHADLEPETPSRSRFFNDTAQQPGPPRRQGLRVQMRPVTVEDAMQSRRRGRQLCRLVARLRLRRRTIAVSQRGRLTLPLPSAESPLGCTALFGQPRSEPNVKTVPDAFHPLCQVLPRTKSRMSPFTLPIICLSRSSSRWNVKRRRAYAPANRESIQVSVKRKSAPETTRPRRNSVCRRPSLARRRREGTAS